MRTWGRGYGPPTGQPQGVRLWPLGSPVTGALGGREWRRQVSGALLWGPGTVGRGLRVIPGAGGATGRGDWSLSMSPRRRRQHLGEGYAGKAPERGGSPLTTGWAGGMRLVAPPAAAPAPILPGWSPPSGSQSVSSACHPPEQHGQRGLPKGHTRPTPHADVPPWVAACAGRAGSPSPWRGSDATGGGSRQPVLCRALPGFWQAGHRTPF